MISAVVLAAGQSRRMGCPKINLPWGQTTVLGQILQVLRTARLGEIVVVAGEVQPQMQPDWQEFPLRLARNPQPAQGEMLGSLQVGLRQVHPDTKAVLVVLGDQPQIQVSVVEMLLGAFARQAAALIVPSYRLRRGHPWLVQRDLFQEVLSLTAPATLRDFLNQHQSQIFYLPVDTESVLQDLDTPQDYDHYKPVSAR